MPDLPAPAAAPDVHPADLPGRLQLTFLPAEGTLAWWGTADVAAALRAHGLPEGRPSSARLAIPVDGELRSVLVPVRLADPERDVDALLKLDVPTGPFGDSVRTWREAARLPGIADGSVREEVAARMPPAAHAVPNDDGTAVMSAGAALGAFARTLRTRAELAVAAVDAEFRPYQLAGVAWLRSLAEDDGASGGGVLADEMGLGKTLQAIGLLATRRAGPHLVVCPTSLVANWRRELARFAPGTPVIVHHGPRRDLPAAPPPGAVVVTGYGVLRADDALPAIDWDVLILDEAQQIKNPDALASRAAARLPARLRIAMTGTPVENRLGELWAILNVTNPGLLGPRARFRQRFAVPIERRRSPAAAARLNALVAPYLLRRTKAEVLADLPPKQHSTITCTLTAEQERLYREAVDRAFADGLGSGIERRGRVLALLTALKQICNHPAQYLGAHDTGEDLAGRSGKFDRATEMLTEIADDRVLVFTQYRAMGELLARHLSGTLGTPVPFLHGGLGPERRDRLVQAFQNDPDAPPVLLLSLRAAGFGLNLTRAGHVVHYDRWWNPAVEDQATDRAHRIGQRRALNVHTLVTAGTIEEHVAAMHESKRALAGVVAGNAEGALADLSDADLRAALEGRTA
ncbi:MULTISPECIES: DEAD/DEAH box helicase [Actinomadura]|uniref:DEAD/DEAH box helicase n=1 Tax=Actinomadura yumaensis TaxID=111807 RepID=A0ABW2CSH2_9ACTN|nr:DEAD/DEAH box helicase [Actinomadura sp. J1-007]MWK35100.1 ATP-dependent helicase [Actinomadura sp. J1-007]